MRNARANGQELELRMQMPGRICFALGIVLAARMSLIGRIKRALLLLVLTRPHLFQQLISYRANENKNFLQFF
jgi:hypothetical protein